MKVQLIKCKSKKLKDIQNYIAQLCSVVRDKSPKSAEKLFNRLLTESAGDKPSRVLEYVPCTIDIAVIDSNPRQFFGFDDEDKYYTNARELLNWGWSLDQVIKVVDFKHYSVFKCETPYFIYGQVSTHTQLTTISHSQRYAHCDRGYWVPPEIGVMLHDYIPHDMCLQTKWNKLVSTFRPNELRDIMKKAGISRKEVFDRGVDMLQNRVFIIGGYTNNRNAWGHFLEQRLDSHTQFETREFVKQLDELLFIT